MACEEEAVHNLPPQAFAQTYGTSPAQHVLQRWISCFDPTRPRRNGSTGSIRISRASGLNVRPAAAARALTSHCSMRRPAGPATIDATNGVRSHIGWHLQRSPARALSIRQHLLKRADAYHFSQG